MAVALDHAGPCGVDYEPFSETWINQGIVQRFLHIASRYPDHAAIVDSSSTLSYAAVRAAVLGLATRIAKASFPSGPIGILLPQSADFWVAIMACLAAGRPYVALDMHHPVARNADIFARAALAAVIAPVDFDPAGAIIPPSLHRIASDAFSERRMETLAEPVIIDPGTPAVILYTSGSSGHPKGIANNEAALLQRVAQYVNACHLHAGDRFLTLSSPCTIAGTREGLTALLVGATLHVIDAQRRGLGDIAQCIRDAGITVFNSVPSVLRAMIAAHPDAADALQTLRIVRIGGEIVFWSDIRQFRGALPAACHIQIGYSSTESTGTQWFVPPDTTADGPFVPVGYLLPGNLASVLDETGHAVSPGDVGELVLRGRYIALGLWQNGQCGGGDICPDDADPTVRVLHTGDLAQIDASGLCTILGRKDRQVKINGVRVEPAEVEAVLRDLRDTADAAVITRRIETTMALVAFVVPRHPAPHLIARLRAELRTRLPASMRPSRIHIVAAIPQLPSGKPDLHALDAFDREADATPAVSDDASTTNSDIRSAVHRAWRSVLGRRSLSDALCFEDAGGDSLKLLQLVLALETRLGHRLPLDLVTGDMYPDDLVRVLRDEYVHIASDAADHRPTIVLLPGLDGDEPRLAAFRAAMHERMRFVVIDYPDWPEMVQQGRGFDALVAKSIEQVCAAVPKGPLLFAGYSFGGDVAFAMASRMAASGRTVNFLGILDTNLGHVAADAERFRNGYMMADRREVMQNIARDRLDTCLGLLLAKCARDVVGLDRALRSSRFWRPLLSSRTAFAFDRRIRSVLRVQARWRWQLATQFAPIDVPTVLFRSSEHAAGTAVDLGWDARCATFCRFARSAAIIIPCWIAAAQESRAVHSVCRRS